ncbi:MAG: dihydroorotase, partial [Microcystaceae cyanobacterium]
MVLSESQILHQVRYLDPLTAKDTRVNLWIQDGQIQGPETSDVPPDTQRLDAQNLIVAPGLFDLYSYSGEPGHEDRETLSSLMGAAWAGGFTEMALLPNTQPVVDNPAILQLLKTKLAALDSKTLPKVHFWGSLTLDCQGEQLSELIELIEAGIVGFTDNKPLNNLGLVRRALEYLQPVNKPLALVPINTRLRGNGVIREGEAAIRWGLPGEAVMTETTAIAAIVEVVEELQTPVHLMRISTARGVELIAQAKARNLPITASVTWMHLLFNTESVGSYNPNLHLDPPLGNEPDRLALIEGIKTGIIDGIAVDHRAYSYEEKTLAFAESPPGAIGLELALPCLWQALVRTGNLTALELWQALSVNALRCLGLPFQPKNYLLFDPQFNWSVEAANLQTQGENT